MKEAFYTMRRYKFIPIKAFYHQKSKNRNIITPPKSTFSEDGIIDMLLFIRAEILKEYKYVMVAYKKMDSH